MARPLNDSPYLYGLHDPGGEHIMAERGIGGWILFTEELGSDPNDQRGTDYSGWTGRGFGVIARLNNGYEPHGTLPYSNRYAAFATRCAGFVRSSRGCNIWIIGNEMNFAVERPGVEFDRSFSPPRLVRPGETILPGMYANCYRQCRAAIRAVTGHEKDQVIVGAVAPWNPQTAYDGNPNGDWVKYFQDILTILGPANCDGMSIHAYTHGADPELVHRNAYMDPPFQNRQYNFRVYQDFMNAVPRSMRHLPVYLTETDQNEAWLNHNNGWVQRIYGEIDWWNRQPGNQVIRAVILYRWPNIDKWGIDGKAGVIEDLVQSMAHRYNWEQVLQSKPAVSPEEPVVEPHKPTPAPVEPAQPAQDTSPIKFPATGKTAEGLFAAFHRRYGLDITGYPISEQYVSTASGLKTQDWQRLQLEEVQGKVRLALVGQEARDLRERVARLEQQIARLQSGEAGPLEPEITDITAQLPRDPAGFAHRELSEIQFLVINHTGVRPEVGANRIAQAHRARWPGIVAQYFVTGDAHIQQTNPVDAVVSRDQGWIRDGISIYVAGSFNDAVPSERQLDALAELCAWLLYRYKLPETAIKGASELIKTQSPGMQWLTGQHWKDQLLQRMRAVPFGPSVPAPQPSDEGELAAVRAQLSEVRASLAASEQQRARLQAQLEAALKGSGGVPRPEIADIALQLPRNAGSLKKRPPETIRYVVVNHTAVDAGVTAERLAAAHQKRWGAILYQYLVMADGRILQTNALDEVVDLGQPWIAQGINIAVAGSFNSGTPPESQLKATAALIAWLMHEHAVPLENVKGVSEFIGTQSPGTQWLKGSRWKDLLLAAVAEIQQGAARSAGAGDMAVLAALQAQITQLQAALDLAQGEITALQQERDRLLLRLGEPDPDVAKLRQQVQTLTAEKAALEAHAEALARERAGLSESLKSLNTEKAALTRQVETLSTTNTSLGEQIRAAAQEKALLVRKVGELEARIKQLQGGGGAVTPATGGSAPPPSSGILEPPPIIDIVDRLPRHATAQYRTRTLAEITHIAIHHSAAPASITPERIAQYHVGKDWPGMGYHFYVGPDGAIYQCNRLETVSYQVYNQNHYSLGICLAGSFVGGLTPTPKQLEQVGHLAAWLMQKLRVPLQNVMGHKEYPDNATTCPGSDWVAGKHWKDQLVARIKAVQGGQVGAAAKTLGHYVLFWERGEAWAKEDWTAAAAYFERFRPTAGFSPNDARNAEYVTIVGGTAGVPYETEQMLVTAGCKVERLAGIDYADTKRMLDELAASGKRFRTFSV